MKTIKLLLIITTTFIQIINCQGQCTENILANGSFDGQLGDDSPASGWMTDLPPSSPDLNDASGQLYTAGGMQYVWAGDVINSMDGGTWQNIIGPETIFQTVNLEIDTEYSLCFEYAAQGITNVIDAYLTFADPVGVEVYINDALIAVSPIDSTQYTWETFCVNFTATQVANQIKFRASDFFYLGIDGACLNEATPLSLNVVPENSISTYPNPISREGILNFGMEDNSIMKRITITDSSGKLITQKNNVSDNQIELSNLKLNTGVYFISMQNNKGKNYIGKFVCY